ncbi:CoA ester lyase [Rhodoferax koreense]|uniref:CoA ester lyase n=1 Tax=Rhodoferax koreensis TaxID=1842727 RepID=A0A1P8K1C8_9BURK|nr:CoA ester lyase [Rhodoferax koreense]APW39810.1 CoA ester lyase [Rhodoferax koreense]
MSELLPVARTYLFVPGMRPERFGKALASGADAVVLDLEDAVAPEDKAAARSHIAGWLRDAAPQDRARAVVRINDAASAWFADDLAALSGTGVTQILLPKAEQAAQVAAVLQALPGVQVLALIESARGVAEVEQVAGAAGVTRLVFGTLDYALDLDLDIRHDAVGLGYAAARIAIASRLAGLAAPVAGVTPQFDDETRLLADLSLARCNGFGAKLCIHPGQVAPIHRALQPSEAELTWARRVLAADAATPGAARLDGRMVDLPVVRLARRTLLSAGR